LEPSLCVISSWVIRVYTILVWNTISGSSNLDNCFYHCLILISISYLKALFNLLLLLLLLLLFIIYIVNLPVVRPRSCRVIYYFDISTLGRRYQSFGRVIAASLCLLPVAGVVDGFVTVRELLISTGMMKTLLLSWLEITNLYCCYWEGMLSRARFVGGKRQEEEGETTHFFLLFMRIGWLSPCFFLCYWLMTGEEKSGLWTLFASSRWKGVVTYGGSLACGGGSLMCADYGDFKQKKNNELCRRVATL
jgi:hypothetical protein